VSRGNDGPSLRSKFGKAAVIGGRAYIERFATSEEFAAIFRLGLDPAAMRTTMSSAAFRPALAAVPVPTSHALLADATGLPVGSWRSCPR